MAKYREVFKTEKYMDDVSDYILSNIVKGAKRRKHLSIWDPIEPPIETESYDSDLSKRNKILTKILSNDQDPSFSQNTQRIEEEKKFASGTAVKRNVFANRRPPKSFYPELRSNPNNKEETKIENLVPEEYNLAIRYSKANHIASESIHPKEQISYGNDQTCNNNSIANSNLDVQNYGSTTLEKTLSSCPLKERGNPLTEIDDKILLNNSVSDCKSMESETVDVVADRTDQRNDFTAWCKRRHEQFNVSSSNNHSSQREVKEVTFKTKVKKDRDNNPAPVMRNKMTEHANKYSKSKGEVGTTHKDNKITDHAKKYSKTKSEVDISHVENKKSNHAKKYSKSRSEVDISNIENGKLNHAKKYSKNRSEDNLVKTKACFKLANDENHDKNDEFLVDISDISRIKRKFPKLNDILPDIDAAITTVPCCFEAVTIILRYLFYGKSKLTDLPNATVAVEVLAATKDWKIEKIYSIYFDIFVQEILPTSNIKFIFSQASHYNLHDVCRACEEINENRVSLNSTYRRKQKTCTISVVTYIEPLEFSIPLHTMEHYNFELSFERHILNTIRFQALLGSFTIVGIYINLNNDLLESCSNNSLLNIDYNAKNVTEDIELGNGRIEKPLRPINIIYFKNPLEVNSGQLMEITVETDLKPFLCSTSEEILIRKRKKGGEFRLNVVSNFKIPKSNESVYIVGKLIYSVKNSQSFK